MRNLYSAFKKMLSSLFSTTASPPKNSNATDLTSKAKEWCRMALNLGIEGKSLGNLLIKITGAKEQLISDENAHFDSEKTNLKKTLEEVDRNLKEPIQEKTKKAKAKLSPGHDKDIRALDEKYSPFDQQLNRKTKKVQDWKVALTDWVASNGGKPESKTFFDKKPARVLGVFALFVFEAPFTFTALQSYGVASNITLIFFTFTFSALIALCADLACRFLSERRKKAAITGAIAGLIVCFVVIGIRMNAPEPASPTTDEIYASVDLPQYSPEPFTDAPQGDAPATTFSGIEPALNITTLILYLLGLTFAYLTHRYRPFWSLSEKIDRGEIEIDDLQRQLQQKPKAYEEAEKDFEKKVELDVQDEMDRLQSQHDEYAQKLEQLEIDRKHSLQKIEHRFQEIIADVNAAYEEGKR